MASTNRYGTVGDDPPPGLTNGSGYRSSALATDKRSPDRQIPAINNVNQYLDRQILNKGTDEELECIGYQDSLLQLIFFYLLVVLSGGLLLLLMYWKPSWNVKMTKRTCPLKRADTVMLRDMFGVLHIEKIVIVTLTDGPVTNNYSSCDTLDTPSSKAVGEYAYLDSDSISPDADDTTMLTLRSQVFLKYFDHKHVRYIWDQKVFMFCRLRGLETGLTCGDIHDKYHGLSQEEQAHKQLVYGENAIVVDVKSYVTLFFQEILNPFYIFQICSVILWSLDDYYIYASCIVFISALSLGVELYETRKQSETLRQMVASADTTITVVRQNGDTVEMQTTQLVPGDVIIIPPQGCVMSCDAVLVSGNAIVNESMLTGESVPVTKTPLIPSEVEEMYTPDTHKRHTLFCGTQVIQTRYYGDVKVKAVVVRTGYNTAKGDLVRSILYPKPVGFRFYQDSMKFVAFLFCIATLGMIYSIVILIHNGETVGKVVLRALDIITIVVPPALPAAMTVGTAYAQNRLKKQGIFCISPPRINIAGKLKLIVFDKTGTLTEEGLDLWGIVPIEGNKLGIPSQNPAELPLDSKFVVAMATCHSLTIIDNELTGDPLDLKMFQSINWIIEEPGRDTAKFDSLVPTIVKPIKHSYNIDDAAPYEIGIVRQFPFSSNLQRMSVLVRILGADQMEVYAKGAPEKIATLCKKQTVPENFFIGLQKFTRKGYRVIAMAWKPLDTKISWHQAQRLSREQVESDLSFLGLLVMENMLKPQTTPVIKELQAADIRTVMATGDNILTAVSVAHQCGMIRSKERIIMVNAYPPDNAAPAKIEWELANVETEDDLINPRDESAGETSANKESVPEEYYLPNSSIMERELSQQVSVIMESEGVAGYYHLALTGRSFSVIRQHFPDLLPKICVRGVVFARMSPDQKSQLVEILQELGYCVGMCGDGANDCGALKTAQVGISLSEAEASVASPFTSKTQNIECVPIVIREGRAALVTSFGVFKYMALYSIVQFVSVLILYTMRTNFSDWMFLYIDLVITTTVAFLMGHTAAYPFLVARRPPGSLVSPTNIFSIIIHIIIVCLFQTGAFLYLVSMDWYTRPTLADTDNNKTYETTVVFYISCFQYLMLAFIFSKGPPYRKPIWTNVPFLIALILLLATTLMLVLHPFAFLAKILLLMDIPKFEFRLTIIGMAAINFLIAVLLEAFIIPSRSFIRCANTIRRKKGPRNKYKVIQQELDNNRYWPPVGEITLSTGHNSSFLRDNLTARITLPTN